MPITQSEFTCSKLIVETPEHGVKCARKLLTLNTFHTMFCRLRINSSTIKSLPQNHQNCFL